MMVYFMNTPSAFVMPFGSSSGEMGLVLFVFLLLFGAKKLPEMARTAGRFMEHLRRASTEFRSQLVDADKAMSETRKEFNEISRDLALTDSPRDAGWSDPHASSDDEDPWGAIDYDDADLEAEPSPPAAEKDSSPVIEAEEDERGV